MRQSKARRHKGEKELKTLNDKFLGAIARMDLTDFLLVCDALDVKTVEQKPEKSAPEDRSPARDFDAVLIDVLRAFDELVRRDKKLLLKELEQLNKKEGYDARNPKNTETETCVSGEEVREVSG